MKKLIAVVLAVVLLASIGGAAMAANYQPTGNNALSGPHYNLNIIGVQNPKTADMTGTSGHTIFVPLNGRAKIELYPSTDVDLPPTGNFPGPEDIEAYADCNKDFLVMDRNAFDDPAQFCLPVPLVDESKCGEGASEVSYTVFARALGTPGGKSFTTTCATDPSTGDIWCSSITMRLERLSGKRQFIDVSRYLLFIYVDGTRYSLFDKRLEGYFWRYDNNGLKLAQLRFYMNPTCVPDEVPGIVGGPIEVAQCSTAYGVVLDGNALTDFTGVTEENITVFDPGKGDITVSGVIPINGNNDLQLDITVGNVPVTTDPEHAPTIYIDLQDGSGYTISVDLKVIAGVCP